MLVASQSVGIGFLHPHASTHFTHSSRLKLQGIASTFGRGNGSGKLLWGSKVHVSKGVRPRVTNVDQAESLHRQLFDGFDYHRALGAAETDSQAIGDALSDGEWFYGEFTYESFAEMLRQVSPAPGSIFVDLGSGCGKALFAAALSCPQLGECRGVEILPALAEQSLEVLRRYEVLSAKVAGSCGLRLPPVTLEVGNMYYSNAWAGADLVYCFATMLGPRSLQLLQMRVEDMRPGAQALIVSKRLSSPLLQEEAVFYLSMAQNGEDMPCFLCKRV